VLAENKLFATLRPTSRQGFIEGIGPVVLTDTVGFIRDLPKDLTRAFRSTLEEIGDADVLLHVLDAASPGADTRFDAVNRILEDLGFRDMPTVVALNKADATDEDTLRREQGRILDTVGEETPSIPTSALNNRGLPELREALADAINRVQREELAVREETRERAAEWR
jgi:GTP-binding protein HflX